MTSKCAFSAGSWCKLRDLLETIGSIGSGVLTFPCLANQTCSSDWFTTNNNYNHHLFALTCPCMQAIFRITSPEFWAMIFPGKQFSGEMPMMYGQLAHFDGLTFLHIQSSLASKLAKHSFSVTCVSAIIYIYFPHYFGVSSPIHRLFTSEVPIQETLFSSMFSTSSPLDTGLDLSNTLPQYSPVILRVTGKSLMYFYDFPNYKPLNHYTSSTRTSLRFNWCKLSHHHSLSIVSHFSSLFDVNSHTTIHWV